MTFAARDFSPRRGVSDEPIPQWICEERATKSGRKRPVALRVAPNLACGFVARRLQPHGRGCALLAPRHRPNWAQRTSSYICLRPLRKNRRSTQASGLCGSVLIWWRRCCGTAVRRGSGAPSLSRFRHHLKSTALEWLMLFAATLALAQIPKPTDAPGPMTPEQSAAAFKLPAGFRMEVVASEPLIASPSAVCWD